MTEDFSRRVLVCLDVEDYSSRNDVEQHAVQDAVVSVLDAAAVHAGFDRSRWSVQPVGDGALVVLPAGESERRVVDDLPIALAHALATHNGATHNGATRTALRLRVRLGVHEGLVRPATGGHAGTGVVVVSRMVDSPAARSALVACPGTDLAVLLSPPLYVELVLQRHTRLSAEDFREVAVRTKKFRGRAWLHVPGHDVHALALDEAPAPDPPAPDPPAPERPPTRVAGEAVTRSVTRAANVHQTTFHGGVRSDRVVIGINYEHPR